MKNDTSITFKTDEEFVRKLDEIARFYDIDRSKLIKSVLMGFILSWIDQRENGHTSDIK